MDGKKLCFQSALMYWKANEKLKMVSWVIKFLAYGLAKVVQQPESLHKHLFAKNAWLCRQEKTLAASSTAIPAETLSCIHIVLRKVFLQLCH